MFKNAHLIRGHLSHPSTIHIVNIVYLTFSL